MDLSDLQRYATAAREFSVAVGPADAARHITLRLPTQHEISLAGLRSGLMGVQDDAAAHLILQRSLLLQAMVAWSGVLVGDVLADSDHAQDIFSLEPGAAQLLLDAQPDWEATLGKALMQRLAERKTKKDTATKN
jgi:hypothetical protein